ncbi:MAG TPA: hypothetical protein VKD70_04910 [Candidatus Acidoferrum sp.]|nr:hypothetical protein [Candidatus Acidoferrum sp.]
MDLDEFYCHFYPHVAPGRYAVLSVSDTCVGMGGETKERICAESCLVAQRPTPLVSGAEMRGAELILIDEDHDSLQHRGYQALFAENGEEALNSLEGG